MPSIGLQYVRPGLIEKHKNEFETFLEGRWIYHLTTVPHQIPLILHISYDSISSSFRCFLPCPTS